MSWINCTIILTECFFMRTLCEGYWKRQQRVVHSRPRNLWMVRQLDANQHTPVRLSVHLCCGCGCGGGCGCSGVARGVHMRCSCSQRLWLLRWARSPSASPRSRLHPSMSLLPSRRRSPLGYFRSYSLFGGSKVVDNFYLQLSKKG